MADWGPNGKSNLFHCFSQLPEWQDWEQKYHPTIARAIPDKELRALWRGLDSSHSEPPFSLLLGRFNENLHVGDCGANLNAERLVAVRDAGGYPDVALV